MSDWIKFHAELTKGAKRGLRRAHRFIYMELSLHARPLAGIIELPVGMGDVEGVVDLLGGDAREVRDAIAKLSSGVDPMLRFEGPDGARRLVIVTWERWNDAPGGSTERVRRHRNKIASEVKRVTRNDPDRYETDLQRSGNAPRGEEIREEERRDPPLAPPPKPDADSTSESSAPVPVATPGETPKGVTKRGTRCPSSTAPNVEAWLAQHEIPSRSDHVDGLEVAKMLDHFAASSGARGAKLDWLATWRNWRREADRRSGKSAAPVQRTGGYQPIEERKRAELIAEIDASRGPQKSIDEILKGDDMPW